MAVGADIIVIGGGIAGSSAAAMLASSVKVVLLEAEHHPGYHATGRSAAYFAPAYGNAPVRRLTSLSEPFMKALPGPFSAVPLLQKRNSLFIATPAQLQSLDKLAAENPGLERLEASALQALVPVLKANTLVAGLLDRSGGDLNVDAILQGYLKQFRQAGGTVETDARVTGLEHKNGMWKVMATSGLFEAPIVINAAGAWADQIGIRAGVGALGLTPLRRTAALVDAPQGVEATDWPLVIDVDEQFYFKPDAGQILVSPADETPQTASDAQADDYDVALGIDRVQAIAELPVTRVNHSWAGLRTFSKDRTPVAGFDPRLTGFFWLAGQGGYGVQTCAAMAELTCQLVTGDGRIADLPDYVDLTSALAPDRLL